MTGTRRSAVLIGCSLVLGGLAAADVARQERALRERLGRPVAVVVATREIKAGTRIDRRWLAVRSVPERYAPASRYSDPVVVSGLTASRAIEAGADLQPSLLDQQSGPAGMLRAGESVAQLSALGAANLVPVGSRVDVIATEDSGGGRARTVLRGAEVLSVRTLSAEEDGGAPRVEVALRVRLTQVEELARVQDYARSLRVVPRPAS